MVRRISASCMIICAHKSALEVHFGPQMHDLDGFEGEEVIGFSEDFLLQAYLAAVRITSRASLNQGYTH